MQRWHWNGLGSVHDELESLRERLAAAADEVVQAWAQDEEGFDEVYGSGGPCDEVAYAMADVLAEADFDVHAGGHEGDDHAYNVAVKAGRAFVVDVPPSVYETGCGYVWRKRTGATVRPSDIAIYDITDDWFER